MFKERDAKLKEAGDLHRFLRDLDHFQAWLTKTPRRMLPLKTFLLLWRKLRSFWVSTRAFVKRSTTTQMTIHVWWTTASTSQPKRRHPTTRSTCSCASDSKPCAMDGRSCTRCERTASNCSLSLSTFKCSCAMPSKPKFFWITGNTFCPRYKTFLSVFWLMKCFSHVPFVL